MNKLLAGLLALAIASPAFAWGDREQGILTGSRVNVFDLHDSLRHVRKQLTTV